MESKIYDTMEQRTPEWYDIRRGKITSTGAKTLMAVKGLGAAAITYALELISADLMDYFDDDGYVNSAMQYGQDTEPIARDRYELEKMIDVKEVGFITKGGFLGASPDGLVGDDGIIEIKCAQPNNHIKWILANEVPKEHIDQVQYQMYVADRKYCDFVFFNDHFKKEYQMRIIRVLPDPKWVAKFESRLAEFKELFDKLKKQLNGDI